MPIELKPQPGPQTQALASPADVLVMGGARGGTKTYTMQLEAARHIDNPGFRATFFRDTKENIRKQGSLLDTCREMYIQIGARSNTQTMEFVFPSDARISLDGLGHVDDFEKYKGAQIALMIFEELTEILETNFWSLFASNRSMHVRPYIRATCNPQRNSWVADLLEWWINQDETDLPRQVMGPWGHPIMVGYGYPIPERGGMLRWFWRQGGVLNWADTPGELVERFELGPTDRPKSFTFIPATLQDNKILMAADPDYRGNLLALPEHEMQAMLLGNWKARQSGNTFPPIKYAPWPTSGVLATFAFIDAAFHGAHRTAHWIAVITKTHIHLDGMSWRRHVEQCFVEIVNRNLRFKVGSMYSEDNADKGAHIRLLRSLSIEKYGWPDTHARNASVNKHVRIMHDLYGPWRAGVILFHDKINPTSRDYVVDYKEGADPVKFPNDDPDSAAGVVAEARKILGV